MNLFFRSFQFISSIEWGSPLLCLIELFCTRITSTFHWHAYFAVMHWHEFLLQFYHVFRSCSHILLRNSSCPFSSLNTTNELRMFANFCLWVFRRNTRQGQKELKTRKRKWKQNIKSFENCWKNNSKSFAKQHKKEGNVLKCQKFKCILRYV